MTATVTAWHSYKKDRKEMGEGKAKSLVLRGEEPRRRRIDERNKKETGE